MAATSLGEVSLPEQSAAGELITQIAQGDDQALSKLYDSTSRLIYGLVLRMADDPSAAEEVTMEVYLQVRRTAKIFDPSRGSIYSWLVTMARSRAIDRLRSSKTRFDRQRQSLETVREVANPSPSPETAVMGRGRAQRVRQALAALAPDQRQLIELAYFSGLSHSEMAEQLTLPLGTVKSRVRIGNDPHA